MPRLPVLLLSLLLTPLPASAQPAPGGPPFAVSTGPVAANPAPRVIVTPQGKSLYLWLGTCPDFALCARLYDSDGTPLRPPFSVDVPLDQLSTVPAATLGADGRLTLVWSRPGLGFAREIVGRRFSFGAAGTEVAPVGPVFEVAADSAQVYENPAVAVAPGSLVVAFEKLRFDGFSGSGEGEAPIFIGVEILARRLGTDGSPLGALLRVDDPDPDLVAAPAVAAAPDGTFLVAWESSGVVSGDDDVLVRRFAADGTPAGPQSVASASSSGLQSAPAVAAGAQGTFLVAWESAPADGSERRVVAQVFDGGGARFPVEVRAGTGVAAQSEPAASGGDDVFVLAWRDERSGGGVWAERRGAIGQRLGPEFRLDTAQAATTARHPAVAAYGGPAADSGLAAGWTAVADDAGRTVRARLYPAAALSVPPCAAADPAALCLGQGERFELRAAWTTASAAGSGTAEGITTDTGWFWFFNPANLEVVVKVLDACAVNGRYWVFAGGLTNVGVTLTVRDTATGALRTYENPRGTAFQPIQDTGAFPCS